MAAEFSAHIKGLDEVISALRALPNKLRKGVVRNALAAGARIFRDEAKRLTPVLRGGLSVRGAAGRGVRKPGTVRKAIKVRTSKRARSQGNVGVFVNVSPAKGARKGAKSPDDPFYWKFLEFGTQKMRAYEFLTSAGRTKGAEALQKIIDTLGPQIQKMNAKGGTK